MKTQQLTTISVVIPSYNGLTHLKSHLPSVLAQLQPGDEIIIVDDSSTDTTIEWLSSHFKLVSSEATTQGKLYKGQIRDNIQMLVLQHHHNQRFAASANHGAELASHPFILLLNNDVEPLPGLRAELLQSMQLTNVFAVGCLEHDQTITGEVSGKNELFFKRGLYQHRKASNMSSGETAWVSGGSGLFSLVKWKELGGFDQRFYPAYWEDIDLSFRARKNGWHVLFNEEARVIHQHETTNAQVFGEKNIQEMSWKNAFLFSWLHTSGLQKISFLLWQPYWWWKRISS